MKLINGDPTVTVGNIAEFVIYVNMLTWPFASVGWVTSLGPAGQRPAWNASTNSWIPNLP